MDGRLGGFKQHVTFLINCQIYCYWVSVKSKDSFVLGLTLNISVKFLLTRYFKSLLAVSSFGINQEPKWHGNTKPSSKVNEYSFHTLSCQGKVQSPQTSKDHLNLKFKELLDVNNSHWKSEKIKRGKKTNDFLTDFVLFSVKKYHLFGYKVSIFILV